MGNSVVKATINLDHEVSGQQEAIEAGRTLVGKIILDCHEVVDPTDLTLEVNGKERTTAPDEEAESGEITGKHCFFRADVLLFEKPEEPIKANTYVFPFSIPLPKSLPCSRSYYEDDNNGSFRIDYTVKLKTNDTERDKKFPIARIFQVSTSPYRPDEPVPCLLQPEPTNIEELDIPGKGRIFFGAHVRDTRTSRGQQLQVSLACRNQSSCRIQKVVVTLEEEYFWTAGPKGGHGKVALAEVDNATKLPGFMLIGYHESEIDDAMGNGEVVARKMFKDLKNKRNNLLLDIPYHAKESYTGLVVKIAHALKITLVTDDTDDENDDGSYNENGEKDVSATGNKAAMDYPTMSVPIQIGGDPPRTMMANAASLHNMSDHVSTKPRRKFPMVTAKPSQIVVGRSAGVLDNDDNSISEPIPPPKTEEQSLSVFLEELVASISDYEYIAEKLKDLEWAIFLASLSPEDFGRVIGHVNVDFAQPRVAALLARNFGDDFTCAHCAAGLQNTAPVFRSNIVEGLLTYCSDISDNNYIIRENLSEFEQVIVALHALDAKEDPSPPPPPPPPPTGNSITPTSSPSSSRHRVSSPGVRRRRRSKSGSRHKRSIEVEEEKDPNQPESLDICVGNKEHTGTKEFYHFVKYIVTSAGQQEFSPPLFRRIKRKFKDRRFLIRSTDPETEWREVTNRELIDFIGGSYDAERIKQSEAHSGRKGGGYLQDTSDEWSIAISIHSYVSGLANDADDDDDQGPTTIDICFGRASHPGNATLIGVIRRILPEFRATPWGPTVYRAIKSRLKGRRYFVRAGENEWREATAEERHNEIEKYYQHQLTTEAQHSPGNGTPVKTLRVVRKRSNEAREAATGRPTVERKNSKGQLNGRAGLERRNSKGQLIRKHPPKEEQNDRAPPERRNSKGQLIRKHPPLEETNGRNPPERRNSRGNLIKKRPSMERSNSRGQLDGRAPPERRNSKGRLINVRPILERKDSRGNLKDRPASARGPMTNSRPGLERKDSRGNLRDRPVSARAKMTGSPIGSRPTLERKDSKGQLRDRPASARIRAPGSPKSSPRSSPRNSPVSSPKLMRRGMETAVRTAPNLQAKQKPMSMKHAREFDVCFGNDAHPGTKTFHLAVVDAIEQFRGTEWSPPVYKFIRAQLKGRRVFIKPKENLPWREATAPERVEATRKYFEATRLKLNGRS